jgi:hypothetical protein
LKKHILFYKGVKIVCWLKQTNIGL